MRRSRIRNKRRSSSATLFKADNRVAQMYDRLVGSGEMARLSDSARGDIPWSRPDRSRKEYGDSTFVEVIGLNATSFQVAPGSRPFLELRLRISNVAEAP
jgi:hypothetical protein